MTTEISPTLQALLLAQATTFMQDTRDRLALDGHDPLAFYRWAADRQLEDARKFANAARLERLKCTRCGAQNVTTVQVGPYTVCEPCAAVISN